VHFAYKLPFIWCNRLIFNSISIIQRPFRAATAIRPLARGSVNDAGHSSRHPKKIEKVARRLFFKTFLLHLF